MAASVARKSQRLDFGHGGFDHTGSQVITNFALDQIQTKCSVMSIVRIGLTFGMQ
jgi:hypothetical protein